MAMGNNTTLPMMFIFITFSVKPGLETMGQEKNVKPSITQNYTAYGVIIKSVLYISGGKKEH